MTSKIKKTWTSPSLTVYGDVTAQTKQMIKPKQLGGVDDFGVPNVQSPGGVVGIS